MVNSSSISRTMGFILADDCVLVYWPHLLLAGDTCCLPTQGHWCFAGQKNRHRHQRVCCFRCCRMEQLTLELRMLSCLVQTLAQRLQKHPFISCYERIWGFSILRATYINVLVIISIRLLLLPPRLPGLCHEIKFLQNITVIEKSMMLPTDNKIIAQTE